MRRVLAGKSIICVCLALFSGCLEFRSIDQPNSISANEEFNINIESYVECREVCGPYFGICLPIGWSVTGNSVTCTGVYNHTISYDPLVAAEQENTSPAPIGYYWWAGSGPDVDSLEGIVYGTLQVQANDQLGYYSLDYMLGNAFEGPNRIRSNNHSIYIVDNYTPSSLRVLEGDNSVILNWHSSIDTVGLLGYNIFRDQQQINNNIVSGTTFTDDNPLNGKHIYALSSLYDGGDEYLTPYEELLFIGEYVYVSPGGNNLNSGSSFDDALLTVSYAMSVISPDSIHPKTISLAPGLYSLDSTGEEFPISFKSYVSLIGSGQQATILDAGNDIWVLEFKFVNNTKTSFLNITHGAGACIVCRGSNPTIEYNLINGGGAWSGGGIECVYSEPIISNNVISGNVGSEAGGGINCRVSNAVINNNIITSNMTTVGDDGGGGGIYCEESNITLKNNIIKDNIAAYQGGGILFVNSNAIIANNTISGNTTVVGGGIYCVGSQINILNSIFWDNEPEAIIVGNGATVDVEYSNIQDTLWPGEGNISTDPLFRDPLNSDYHLMFTYCGDPYDSPCIDAGDPSILDSLLDCGWGMGWYRSDMGAYGGGDSVNVGIEGQIPQSPSSFALLQNYPNPFNASTSIEYDLPKVCDVTIEIYDVLGRKIQALSQGRQQAGNYSVVWNASGFSSGMYFYRIQAGEYTETKKMLLLK